MNAEQQIEQAAARAQALLERTSYFAELGLEEASADARMCARYCLELADELAAERAAYTALLERFETYTQWHQRHCFNRDGTTRSGISALAFTGRTEAADAA